MFLTKFNIHLLLKKKSQYRETMPQDYIEHCSKARAITILKNEKLKAFPIKPGSRH